jgi:hypothetical protein
MSLRHSEVRRTRAFPIAIVAVGSLAAGTLAACGSGNSSAHQGGGIVAATAFPATSFAFASFDSDPADGEKGQLIGTLLKFPAIARTVKIGPGSDLRQTLITEALKHDTSDKCKLSWDTDFKPWLGNVIGVAGVVENGAPEPVGAIQVADSAKAAAEYTKLVGCAGTPKLGIKVTDKWVYVSKTAAITADVIGQVKSGTLADDANFKSWTAKAGGGGFATAYAAPSVADVLGKVFDSLQSGNNPFSQGFKAGLAQSDNNPFSSICPATAGSAGLTAEMKSMLKTFQGAAVNVRARNGGVEVEGALGMASTFGTASWPANSDLGNLPADTAAAMSIGLPQNFWDQIMTSFGKFCGPRFDRAKLEATIAKATGMSVPGDLNALLGKGLTLALGGGVDVTSIHGPADLPAALLLNGDPSQVQGIVTKLLGNLPPSFGFSATTKGNDVIVSANSAYAGTVTSGGLGSSDAFKDVIPNASASQFALYVNFDQLAPSFSKVPQKIAENLTPLKALGFSEQVNGDQAHFFIRLSTN